MTKDNIDKLPYFGFIPQIVGLRVGNVVVSALAPKGCKWYHYFGIPYKMKMNEFGQWELYNGED